MPDAAPAQHKEVVLAIVEAVTGISTIAPDDPLTGLSSARTGLVEQSPSTHSCALLQSRVAAGANAAFVYMVRLHFPTLVGQYRAVDLEIVLNRALTLSEIPSLVGLIRTQCAAIIYDRAHSPELASLQLADVINPL